MRHAGGHPVGSRQHGFGSGFGAQESEEGWRCSLLWNIACFILDILFRFEVNL